MSVIIAYSDELEGKVRFNASPGPEVCFALHCLATPECHSLQLPWILEMRERLPRDLYEELVAFGRGPSDEWYAVTSLFGHDGFLPFETEIAVARAMSLTQLRTNLLGELAIIDPQLDRDVEVAEALNRDGAAWRDRACDLLERFWVAFLPTWRTLEREFALEVSRLERLRHDGVKLFELLPSVTKHVAWNDDTREIVIVSRFDDRRDAGNLKSFVIRPSHFAIPHPSVDLSDHFAVTTWLPGALRPAYATQPEALAPSLGSLAKPVRLRILALLARSPRSAREIGESLKVAPANVSRHLQALCETGMARRVGQGCDGSDARFQIDRAAIRDLGEQLVDFAAFGGADGAAVGSGDREMHVRQSPVQPPPRRPGPT